MKDNNDIRISMGLRAVDAGWQQMSPTAFFGDILILMQRQRGPLLLSNMILVITADF